MTARHTAESVIEKLVDQYRNGLMLSLSSGQVVDALGVSKATVKRWSDAGKIACHRTPGGHRKFSARAVANVMNSDAYLKRFDPDDAPIPYTVVGVDLGSKSGEYTAGTTMRLNPDGTRSIVSVKLDPVPAAAISEDSASELDG